MSINLEQSYFIIIQNGQSHSCFGRNLNDVMKEDDTIVAQRGNNLIRVTKSYIESLTGKNGEITAYTHNGSTYQTELYNLKDLIDKEDPIIGDDIIDLERYKGVKFHIVNIRKGYMILGQTNGPEQDGQTYRPYKHYVTDRFGRIDKDNAISGRGEHYVVVPGNDAQGLFSRQNCDFDFGPNTRTDGLTNMRKFMYYNWDFNGELGGDWNTSRVVNMEKCFSRCGYFKGGNSGVGKLDVRLVKNMKEMFYDCQTFNEDLSAWIPAACLNMRELFEDCPNLGQDFRKWCTHQDVDAYNAFGAKNGLNGTHGMQSPNYTYKQATFGTCPVDNHNQPQSAYGNLIEDATFGIGGYTETTEWSYGAREWFEEEYPDLAIGTQLELVSNVPEDCEPAILEVLRVDQGKPDFFKVIQGGSHLRTNQNYFVAENGTRTGLYFSHWPVENLYIPEYD